MGLKITRSQNSKTRPVTESSATSSVWSARDLCPIDLKTLAKPNFVEYVAADANGHLGIDEVTQLFDRLWKISREKTRFVVELDMKDVRTTDSRFSSELEFYRRELPRRAGTVRVTNGEQFLP